jgi:hypothetical protein
MLFRGFAFGPLSFVMLLPIPLVSARLVRTPELTSASFVSYLLFASLLCFLVLLLCLFQNLPAPCGENWVMRVRVGGYRVRGLGVLLPRFYFSPYPFCFHFCFCCWIISLYHLKELCVVFPRTWSMMIMISLFLRGTGSKRESAMWYPRNPHCCHNHSQRRYPR